MTAPVPDGTTPPAEAVEAATLAAIEYLGGRCQRRLDYCTTHASWFEGGSLVCRRLARDLELVGYAVAALRLPERDRETEVKVRGEAMTQERLGENIRRAIQAAGMTQKDVAERAEIDPTALSKIVTGKRRVSSLELALICTATGSDVFGLLEAEPIHGPSYRAGLEEGAHWAALREGGDR